MIFSHLPILYCSFPHLTLFLLLFLYVLLETQKHESEDVFKDEDDIPKQVEHEMEVDVGGWTEINETNENLPPLY